MSPLPPKIGFLGVVSWAVGGWGHTRATPPPTAHDATPNKPILGGRGEIWPPTLPPLLQTRGKGGGGDTHLVGEVRPRAHPPPRA